MTAQYPDIKTLQRNSVVAILTGHTCGEACWHARDEVCRCSCGGQNHGILNRADGSRPERTSKKDGQVFVLAGVAPSWREAETMRREVEASHFPGLDHCAYGSFRDAATLPVISRKASSSQLNWPEVNAVLPEERQQIYLVWRLRPGEKYITRSSCSSYNPKAPGYRPAEYSVAT
jgi:hypothetical protein